MELILIRDTFTSHEVVGKIQAGENIYDYIEQPSNHDAPGHSCIPSGEYDLEYHLSGHLHEADGISALQTWALVNPALGVFHNLADIPEGYAGEYPARTECLIHPANFASQLEGCGAPGMTRQQYGDMWEVTNSRQAFELIRTALGGPGATGNTITIQETAT